MLKENLQDLFEFLGELARAFGSLLKGFLFFGGLAVYFYIYRDVDYSNQYLKEIFQNAGVENYEQMSDEGVSHCKHSWDEMTCYVILYPNEKTAVATTIVLEKKLTLVKN